MGQHFRKPVDGLMVGYLRVPSQWYPKIRRVYKEKYQENVDDDWG